MNRRIILLLFLTQLFGVCVFQNFAFSCYQNHTSDANIAKIQNLISDLRFNEAEYLLINTQVNLSDSLYLSSLNVVLQELLSSSFALNTEKDKQLKELIYKTRYIKDENLRRIREAELRLHRSIFLLKYQSLFSSFLEFQKSYNTLHKVEKHAQTQLEYKKIEAVFQLVLSAIPQKYKWLSSFFSFEGDDKIGNELLKEVILVQPQSDAVIYYTLLNTFVVQNKNEKQQFLDITHFDLYSKVIQTMLSFIALKQNQAYNLIDKIDLSEDSYGVLTYLNANITFMSGNYPMARKLFFSYLKKDLKAIYVKDTYYRIALSYWFEGDVRSCTKYMKMISDNGNDMTSVDRYAENFAKSFIENPKSKNKELCEARILFDGGNFKQALSILEGMNTDEESINTIIEYTYRKARIFDRMGDIENALDLYKNTLALGQNTNEYYPVNAALLLGQYYEFKAANYQQAKYFYERVLASNKHSYKSELDYKATLALERINKKAVLLH